MLELVNPERLQPAIATLSEYEHLRKMLCDFNFSALLEWFVDWLDKKENSLKLVAANMVGSFEDNEVWRKLFE